MRVFTIHTRRGGLDPDRDIVVVKEGFCWPAFFFSVVWAVWCRLWLVALGLLVAESVVGAIMAWLSANAVTQAIVSVGLALIIGIIGNDLRRWTLGRRDFIESDIVVAADGDTAEHRFFERHPQLTAEYAR